MSATEAIRAARTAGVRLTADGEDLLLDAASPPSTAVIDKLSRHKAEVLKLLRPVGNGWSAADRHAFFDERAGIAEFDDGLSRSEAEDHAFACSVSEWLNRNPVTHRPDAALPVVIVSTATIRCCPMGSNRLAMLGCIRAAGRLGTPPGKGRPPRHSRQWGLGSRPATK